jgi:hypothetical protein
MNLLNHKFLILILCFAVNLTTTLPGTVAIRETTVPLMTADVAAPLFITQIWSTTEISVVCAFEAPAPTVLSEITGTTITTIIPAATSYPATVVLTVISQVSLEYQFYYSNPDPPFTSSESSVYTAVPTTTVLLAPPSITLAANATRAPVTGSVCSCLLNTARSFTPCGLLWCCPHTWY